MPCCGRKPTRRSYRGATATWHPSSHYRQMVQVWQETWSGLAEQRRRLFHLDYTQDHTADEPSLFVMYTGLALLELLRAMGREDARYDLWEHLYDNALSLVLRLQPGAFFDRWIRVVALLIVALLPADRASDAADQLTASLQRLGGDDMGLLTCVVELAQAGAPAEMIKIAIAGTGTPLDQIVARFSTFTGPLHPGPYMLPAQRLIQECTSLLQ